MKSSISQLECIFIFIIYTRFIYILWGYPDTYPARPKQPRSVHSDTRWHPSTRIPYAGYPSVYVYLMPGTPAATQTPTQHDQHNHVRYTRVHGCPRVHVYPMPGTSAYMYTHAGYPSGYPDTYPAWPKQPGSVYSGTRVPQSIRIPYAGHPCVYVYPMPGTPAATLTPTQHDQNNQVQYTRVLGCRRVYVYPTPGTPAYRCIPHAGYPSV